MNAAVMAWANEHWMITATAIGIGFGWVLERAGLTRARKIAAQFCGSDLTVFKVMFTAIVTAMHGVFWLSVAGAIDRAAIHVPETYLAPQLLGGLVFGVGMVLSGLCPGTACAALASGRIDGLAAGIGVFIGVFFTGVALDGGANFYQGTARGPLTLPEVFQVAPGVAVGAITLLAVAAMIGARVIERRFSR